MATNDQNTTIFGGAGESSSTAIDATAGDPLVLPNGLNPATADFAHDGPDLVMTWPDGSEVVVKDYFMVDPQPDLSSDQGAVVSDELAVRLSGPVAPGMTAQAGAESVAEQPIGQVEKIEGTVTVIRADGSRVELKLGDPVYQGDILETADDGAIGVILADETTFSMAEEGRMVLDEMVYDPGTQEGSVSLSVMQGVFTFVSGNVAKTDPDAMTLNTPVATIGIRGTQVGLNISDGQNLDIVLMEEADGFVGEVVVMNNGGVSVLNGANEFTTVTSFMSSPSQTTVIEHDQMINSFSSALRHLPLNHANVNDFGLQGDTAQGNGEAFNEFDTAAGGDGNNTGLADFESVDEDNPDEGNMTTGSELDAEGLADFEVATDVGEEDAMDLADFDTAAGGEDQTLIDNSITVAVDAAAIGIANIDNVTSQSPPPGLDPDPEDDPVDDPVDDPTPDDPTPDPVPDVDVADAPTITVNDATVNEDGNVALDISVSPSDSGDEISSIVIANIPDGADLAVGTDSVMANAVQAADGTWSVTLSADQLSGLNITPTGDYSGTFDLRISATATDGTASTTTTTPAALSVTVTPVVDTATVTGTATASEDGTAVVNLTTALGDVDDSESIVEYTITNIPNGATLTGGSFNDAGEYVIPADSIGDFTVSMPQDYSGTFALDVAMTVQDSNGDTVVKEDFDGSIAVEFLPVVDTATVTGTATASEDGTAVVNLTTALGDVDDSESIVEYTITNIPNGATLTGGSFNDAGEYVIPADSIGDFTVSMPQDYSGTFALDVAMTVQDSNGDTVVKEDFDGSIAVEFLPVVDTATVTGTATASEDGTAVVNLTTALGDVDDSESIVEYTITNIPNGATLTGGSFNDAGEYVIPADSIGDFTVSMPQDYSGTFALDVAMTVQDSNGDTVVKEDFDGSIAVEFLPVVDTATVTGTATASEDGTAVVNLTTALGDVDDSESIVEYTITNIPNGATLTGGSFNDAGEYVIPADSIGDFTVSMPQDYSGTFALDVAMTVQDSNGDTVVKEDFDGSIAVEFLPVVDTATVTGTATASEDGTAVVNLTTALGDVDDSESIVEYTITNIPNGATLTGGSFNDAGEYVIPADSIGDFTVSMPQDYSGTFALDVAMTVQDSNGDTVVKEDFDGSIAVEFLPVVDTATVTGTATASEDGTAVVNLTTALGDVDDSESIVEYTITNIPNGATLTGGSFNDAGEYVIPADSIGDFTVSMPQDYSGTFALDVAMTVQDSNGDTVVKEDFDGSIAVEFLPVVDTATVTGTATASEDGTAVVNLTTALGDVDDSESIVEYTITNIPNGATLTGGSFNDAGEYVIPADSIGDFTVSMPQDYSGTFALDVAMTVQDSNGDTVVKEDFDGSIAVEFLPVVDTATVTGTATASEDGTAVVNLTTALGDVDDSESIVEYTITNIPNGATLTGGSFNDAGEYVIPADSIGDFTVSMPQDYSGTFALDVAMTVQDSNGDTVVKEDFDGSIAVEFLPVVDTATVTGTATASEDGTAVVNLTTALGDVDDSESIVEYTITNIPNGATLTGGSFNDAGEYVIPADSIGDFTVSMPQDYSGTFALDVAMTVQDSNGDTVVKEDFDGSIAVAFNPVADAPTVTADAVGSVDEGTPIDLSISTELGDTDGSESVEYVEITGVPEGVTLSAGTYNATTETWTLQPSDLSGLQIVPSAEYDGQIDLTITSHIIDEATGLESDRAQDDTTISITVVPVGDTPGISVVGNGAGVEDGADVAIGLTVTPVGDEVLTQVVVSGVPTDASLNMGTDNGDGTWTISAAEDLANLGNLTLDPADDYSGTPNLTFSVTTDEGGTAQASLAVEVNPVADAPTVTADAVGSVDEGTPIDLSISTELGDTDGSESVEYVEITGVPEGVTLSAGTYNATTETWTLQPSDLSGLQIVPSAEYDGQIDLTITSHIIDEATGLESDRAQDDTTISITVVPVGDTPGISVVGNGAGVEDGADVAIGLTVTPVGDEVLTQVVVSGVPTDASLNMGTDNGDGTWTISAAEDLANLGNLTLDPADDYSGTPNLTFSVTTDEGGTAQASLAVEVNPVADAPTVTADAVGSVDEGTPIDLSISTELGDTDGSESVEYVEITGVPEGVTLSAGTYNATTETWTLQPSDLSGLQIVPSAEYDGQIDLTITSHIIDEATGLESDRAQDDTTISITVVPVGDTPGISVVGNGAGVEDGADVAIGLTVTPVGDEVLTQVVVSGVPTDASLNMGTDNGDGTWTISAAEDLANLGNLTLDPADDYSGTPNLTFSVTTDEGGTAQASLAVEVNPVADAPTVTADAVGSVDEGTPIDLSISTELGDTDGSESVEYVEITGVPEGVTLSAGTYNATTETWTLQPSDLSGLQIVPSAEYDGQIDLTITSHIIDEATGLESDRAQDDTTISITVVPVGDTPGISVVGNGAGVEDGADVAIGLTVTPVGDEVLTQVVVSGVPTDASLNMGTDNGDGTWTISAAEDLANLGNLTLDPADDYSGTPNLTFSVTTDEGGTAQASLAVEVNPVADAPTVTADAVGSVDEGTPIDLSISTELGDTDGSESVEYVEITGVPEGVTLSAGTYNATTETWTLQPSDLSGLQIVPSAEYDGQIDLTITSHIIDEATGLESDRAQDDTTISITVVPVGDTPGISVVGNGAGVEDGADVAIGLTVTPVGDEVLTQVVVSGVPTDASLNMGTDNGDGTWTISAAEDLANLGNLTLDPADDYSGTPNLTFSVTTDEGGTAQASLAVEVNPVADAPTVTADAAAGAEDTAIALDIDTSVTDTDGSESIQYVTISDVPEGATLSAGTDNGDGTWTIGTQNDDGSWTFDPADLTGLTITPPANFNGSFELGVTTNIIDEATGLESDTASASTSVNVDVDAVDDNPDIDNEDVAGDEDTSIALDISATGTGGVPVESVTISSIPNGAALSAGSDSSIMDGATQAPDGTWSVTLSPDQLEGLTITPPDDYSGDFDLNITATAEDGSTSTASTNVAVEAVADAPTLSLEIGEPTTTEGGFLPDIDAFPHDLSNIVMYLQNDDGGIDKIKVEDFPGDGLNDVNDLGLQEFIETNYPGTDLVGLTVKAGNNHTPGFGPGEGELVYVASGMTQADLPVAAHADDSYSYNNSLEGLDPTPVGGGSDGGQTYPISITTELTDTDGSESLSVVISGVPDGVTLSAGTHNDDGSWTVPTSSLEGLSMDVPAGTEGFSLTVTSTSTEASNLDSASTTASADIGDVVANPDPTVDSADVSGNEDGTVALNITVSNADTITITGVANGDLSAGTDNGDGSWTLTPTQLEGLTFTPNEDWSGSFNIGVTATAADGTSISDISSIAVNPDADTPTVDVSAVGSVDEGTAIDLNIETAATDTDGSESIESIVISGVPSGVSLSAGTDNGNGTWTLSEAQLDGLQVVPSANFDGQIDLTITTNVIDEATGLASDTASNTDSVSITVVPVGDAPGITVVGNGAGVEDGADVAIGLTVTPSDDEVVTQVVVSGVPTDASLNMGTDNGDGTWTISAAEDLANLGNLTLDPADDYSGTPTLGFTVTTDEGGEATANLAVAVNPVADTPDMSVSAASGDEDSAIALNISTGVTDTDGSESVSSVVISGVPSGAELSAGSYNETTGEWTLEAGDLDGLTITPPTNYNGTFSMSVTTVVTDTATGLPSDTATATQSLNVTVAPVGDEPGISIVGSGSGDEDTDIPIGITVTPVGDESVTSVTITGVPSGASLSLGSKNDDGSWTIDGDDIASLDTLTMEPELHYSGTPTLGVTATTDEGGTVSVDAPVTVHAVADTPNLSMDIGEGTEIPATGSLSLTNMGEESAAYENTIGWYRMDENGEPVEGGVIWADTKQDIGDTFTMDDVDPDTIGFFIVSDGGTQNPNLSSGESVSFQQDGSGNWQAVDSDGNVLQSAGGGGTFFTNPDLNPNDFDYEQDSATVGNMNWEDLLGGGDNDYNDANFNLTTEEGSGEASSEYPVNITTSLVDQDGSETLSLVISGVPDGASLSAGTDNGDGSWTVPTTDLDGLTLNVPASVTDGFSLTATATATEPNGDTASVSVSDSVDVIDVTPEPTVETGDVTGNEDGTVSLDISVENAESVTITGVENGDLSAGTDNGDGSWTLTPEQLDGLSFTPDGDWSGSFDISVTATNSAGETTSASSSVDVTPDADAPDLTTEAASGNEDAAIALNISTGVNDEDGSESITSITISGVPSGAELSAGTDNEDGTWTLEAGDLDGLTITPATDFNGTMNLSVTTVVTDTATGLASDTASATQSLSVTVAPVGDEPGISIVGSGSGDEDTNIPIGITVTPTGGESVASITITGVPSGAGLSLGSQNEDGSWTIDGDDLASLDTLTMEPELHYSGTPTLNITATTDEGGSVSVNAPVNVEAVADAPTLSVSLGEGVETTTGGEDIDVTIDKDNALSTDSGFTVTGRTIDADGNLSEASADNISDNSSPLGFGIEGAASGADSELGYDSGEGVSEQMIVDFDQDVDSVDVSFAWMHSRETAQFEIYRDGVKVGEGTVDGITDQIDPAVTLTADDGGAFDQIVFSAPGNGDDYLIHSIDFVASDGSGETAVEYPLTIETSLVDQDGSETLSLTVDGIPEGATLSAGTQNEDGSWTLSTDDLDGLTVTVGDGVEADFNLTVTATATEPNGDTASTTASVTVETLDAPEPSVSIETASGDEDTDIALDVSVENADSVTISGLPDGAELSAGSQNDDGSWTVSADDLDGLTLSGAEHYSGDFDLTVSATNADGVTVTDTGDVTITGVADAPTLSVSLGEGEAVDGGTGAGETLAADDFSDGVAGWGGEVSSSNGQMNIDHDDSATKTFDFGAENAGKEVTISFDVDSYGGWDTSGSYADTFAVTANGDEIVNTTNADGSYSVTATLDEDGQLQLSMDLDTTACEEGVYIDNFSVVSSGDGWAGESDQTAYDLDITTGLVDQDGSETLSITVSGVPDGAELSAGTDNGDGSWTLSAGDLDGLQVVVDNDVSDDFSLSVMATTTEANGDTATTSSTVTVEAPAAPEPTVSIEAVSGDEDQAIPLDITVANAANVTISGVPSGAQLSAGTYNEGTGDWTVSADDIDGLTLTGAEDYSGTINLDVTATNADGVSATDSSTVSIAGVADAPTLTTGIGDATVTEGEGEGIETVSEDFSDGVSGWSGNMDAVSGKMELDYNDTATKTFSFGADHAGETVTISFDASAYGTWDENGSNADTLTVTANGDEILDTNQDGGTYTLTATLDGNGDLQLSMGVDATSSSEGMYIDNLSISAAEGDAGSSSYDEDDFGQGAGSGAGDDEKEDDLSKYDDEWVGDDDANDVDGEKGDDVLAGKGGADDIEGGKGDDLIFGGAGSDNLEGDDGDDIIFGGSGNNAIFGGDGDDFIISGDGNDDIDGGKDDDVIFSGGGMDKIDGGSGSDTVVFSGAREDYTITSLGNDQYVVEHLNDGDDGVNLVEDIETFQFTDGQFSLDDMLDSNPDDGDLMATYDITIETGLTDTDGSESLSDITISGVPDGASFTAGTDNGDGSWTMNQDDLDGLALQVDNSVDADFSLTVSVTSTEANGDAATSTSSIDVVLPEDFGGGDDGGIMGDTSADALDPLAAMFDDSDTLSFDGEEYDISSLTDGDSQNDYGGAAPIGTKVENEDYNPADNDASDGYSSTDAGSDGAGPDIE